MCFLYSRYSLVQEPCTMSYHVSSLVSPYPFYVGNSVFYVADTVVTDLKYCIPRSVLR